MKKACKTNSLKEITTLREPGKIEACRIGRIARIDLQNDAIWVDYEGNPAHRPIVAKLANSWIKLDDIQQAIDRKAKVQVDFEQGNPARPVIRDIFFSISDLKNENETRDQSISIEAEEIIFSAKKRLVIQCGDTKTEYNAGTGEFKLQAKKITSSADKSHRIKGGAVLVN